MQHLIKFIVYERLGHNGVSSLHILLLRLGLCLHKRHHWDLNLSIRIVMHIEFVVAMPSFLMRLHDRDETGELNLMHLGTRGGK